MALRKELLKSIWYAFTALDVEKSGKVSKSQLKVRGHPWGSGEADSPHQFPPLGVSHGSPCYRQTPYHPAALALGGVLSDKTSGAQWMLPRGPRFVSPEPTVQNQSTLTRQWRWHREVLSFFSSQAPS